MAITTAVLSSWKRDLFNGLHRFCQPRNFTATGNGTQTWTGLSSLVGLSVGNFLSGANVAPGTRIADILSDDSIYVSKPSSGAISDVLSRGDTFMIALIKIDMAGNYDSTSTGYADITGNGDEVIGAGYVAGGQGLTNVDPVLTGTTAFVDFAPDPSWTGASFSTAGCMIYNATRNGINNNPGTSVHDFGGTQTVSNGTFTAVMPVADAANAILRIG